MANTLSVSEISEEINVSKSSIYRYIKNNQLEEILEDNKKKYLATDVEVMKNYFLNREEERQEIEQEKEPQSQGNDLIEKAVRLALEQQKEIFENARIKELERLLSEALEREKKLEQLLNQQQQLHYTYQNEDKKEVSEGLKEEAKKILPPLTLDDSLFEPQENATEKRWWRFGKK